MPRLEYVVAKLDDHSKFIIVNAIDQLSKSGGFDRIREALKEDITNSINSQIEPMDLAEEIIEIRSAIGLINSIEGLVK